MSEVGPRTLDEALALLPGLRRRRSITADDLRWLLNRQRRECTWCGQPVGKGRSTWCGDSCVTAFKLRCDTAYQRQLVVRRDGELCRECGRDTARCGRIAHAIRRDHANGRTRINYAELRRWLVETLGAADGMTTGEVDHILPVAEGGGLTGPDNLRWLCMKCHYARRTNKP